MVYPHSSENSNLYEGVHVWQQLLNGQGELL